MAARSLKSGPATLAAALALACCARQPPPCLLASQHRAVSVTLFFGTAIPGRSPVTPSEWRLFEENELAPHFPDGFTVLEGAGRWRDPATGRVGREASRVVHVVAPDDPTLAARVAAVAASYRQMFRQQVVGVASFAACAAF